MTTIKRVTVDFLLWLQDHEREWNKKNRRHCYLAQAKDDRTEWLAVDNESGDCFTESFTTEAAARNWLKDKEATA